MYEDSTTRAGKIALLAGTPFLLMMGCALDEPISVLEPAIEGSEAAVVAEIITTEGAEYTFLATESGDVGVAIMTPGPMDSTALPGPDTNLVELYQSVSGQPAPEALVVAEQRADDRRRDSDGSTAAQDLTPRVAPGDALEHEPAGDLATQTLAMTANQFQQKYCRSGFDFIRCWPSTYGTPSYQQSAKELHGAMHAPECSVYYRYRYKEGNSWKSFKDLQALKGQTWHWFMKGGKIPRLWEIYHNPQNCEVRYSAWGNF